MNKTNIILPVAGYGRRFREAGYTEEKPLIEVGDKTLLEWSLGCLPKAMLGLPLESVVTVVVREGQGRLEDVADVNGWGVVRLRGPTQGAACTVLAAADGLPPDDPVLCLNADQWFKCDLERTLARAEDEGWDGFILVFPGTGPAWSYAVTDGEDRVVWVIEKKQVSPWATVGVYWWRRAGDLVRSICGMIASGQRTNNEVYLAPSFNFLPLSDKDVFIVSVEEFRGLGTPEQVQEFEAALKGGWQP